MTERADVLLVEDDEAIAELYRLRLAQDGFDVTVARDGEEGLRLATSARPAVIFLDLRLPKLGGLDLLRRLRGDPAGADITVVILTNYEEPDLGMVRSGLGVAHVLLKSETTPAQLASLTASLT